MLYNEYLKTNYFLVSCYYYIMGKRISTKKIKFLKFENDKYKLNNQFIFSDSTIDDYDKVNNL